MQRSMSSERVAFSLYLRTGRRIAPAAVEVKFNPWHDEEDGRFTFAGQGRYFGAGGYSAGPGTPDPGKARNDDGLSDRSRNQAQAGKPNRLEGHDGGHFIAARFNGPSDSYNHFAQNSNFNRGSYRVMEDSWAKELRGGHKVFVDIEPLYHGASKRPYQLNVTWYVDGRKSFKKFPNEAKGAEYGKR